MPTTANLITWALENAREDGDPDDVTTAASARLTALLGESITPAPHVSLLNGGLVAEWRGEERDLVLQIAAKGAARLHRLTTLPGQPVTQEVTPDPDPAALAEALDWYVSQWIVDGPATADEVRFAEGLVARGM